MFDSWNVSLGNERVCMALTMHKIEHNIKKVYVFTWFGKIF